MQDYSISKCTRKCAISGRALAPGESYVSVILPNGESVTRIDVAASEWQGANPDAIGWWKCRMPDATAKKLRPAPNGVLLDTLSDLLERPGKEQLAYLLALLLVRRRVLNEENSFENQPSEAPLPRWSLFSPADGRQWNVTVQIPSAATLDALQEELKNLLFTEV